MLKGEEACLQMTFMNWWLLKVLEEQAASHPRGEDMQVDLSEPNTGLPR